MSLVLEDQAFPTFPSAAEWRRKPRPIPLWPMLAICFFAISSGSVTLAGLPRTFMLSVPVVAIMLFFRRFRAHPAGLTFAGCFLAGYIPGTINAIAGGTLDGMSLANLGSSVVMFIIIFGYMVALSNCRNARKTEYLFFFLATFSLVEILFYHEVLSLRYLYYGDVIADHSSRDALLYGLSRPTGFFTEPSNFARFVSLMLALHMVQGRKIKRTAIWFFIFLVLTRSPVLFYAAPVMVLAAFKLSVSKRWSGHRLSSGMLRLLVGITAMAVLAGAAAFQQERIQDVIEGSEGSFSGRLALPAQFILGFWEHPVMGDGPTPNDQINDVVNTLFIAAGRDWLVGKEFRIGIAPTLVVVIGMGVFGVMLFVASAVLALGKKGWWMVAIFFVINLLGTGTNAPAMFVPSSMALAMCWTIWNVPILKHETIYRLGSGNTATTPTS